MRISIHPPREGWDYSFFKVRSRSRPFQSTHPVRGGTVAAAWRAAPLEISIHPPREGWDF